MLESGKKKALTFQELLFTLQTFWAEHGCVLQQPYDLEVGAGTMSPDTFLRVLGPRPIRIAYAQPSRRPADGRYGENPNRLFRHTQLQVILKTPPERVQELYLQSLEALGIDLREHDIKFEEDNWEWPVGGAWAGRSCWTARRSRSSRTSSSAAAWIWIRAPVRSRMAWSGSRSSSKTR